MVRMAEREPQPAVARRRADDRHHVRRAGARAHPGIGVEAIAKRKQLARDRLGAVQLDRRLHSVAQGELRPGGQADTAAHRRQEITALGVQDRVVEHRLAGGAVVHVVAALHRERQVVAQAPDDGIGPRSERHDGVARGARAVGGAHSPSAAVGFERRGIALHQAPAHFFEPLKVSERHRLRIDRRQWIGPVQRALEDRREVRFFLLNLLSIQGGEVDAELVAPALRLGEAQVALALGAEHLHPAAAAEKIHRAGLGGERLVLGDAMLDQLRVELRDRPMARRARVMPVLPEKGREPWDRRRVVVRVDRAVEAVAQERAEVVREAVGIDPFALHQAGVAEGRFFGGAAPVDEHGGAAALLQMQCDANSNYAGAED